MTRAGGEHKSFSTHSQRWGGVTQHLRPLSLSEDSGETYLECKIHNEEDTVLMQHWNKNEGSEVRQRFYKGTHALSYSEFSHKIGAVIGTLVRMKRNTSTDELLQFSLAEKWKELKFLQYSKSTINRVKKTMDGREVPRYKLGVK